MKIFFKNCLTLFFVICHIPFGVCFDDKATNALPSGDNGAIHTAVSVLEHSQIKCLLLSLSENPLFLQIAKIIKFDLEFTDQIDVELKKTDKEPDVKVMRKLFEEGISLCVFIKGDSVQLGFGDGRVSVTLKEPSSGRTIYQKSFDFTKKNIVYDAHVISDCLFPVLTGQHGPMLSTLAYCKQLSHKSKAICISDYACKHEKVLYKSSRINHAPRWHTQAPMLFFSQITRDNNRLLSIDLKTNLLRVVCSYDGLSMQPSFSEDGTKAVLCMSGRKNSELYLYDQALCKKLGKKAFIQVTSNNGNNASPCYLPNGDVIFCSDFQTGQPQIYHIDIKTKRTKRITNGKGYCAAPSFCKKNNSIVFCKLINGYFQLFSINLDDKSLHERQLTFDSMSKQEPVWSDCGNYVAFSVDYLHPKNYKNIPQIAVLNLTSRKTKILTFDDKPKSFPCWTSKTYYNY